ncbi:MAG: 2-C-methyl-D-erythritol 2,4-cyclodiphosphate synthase [Candidatus Omnitrophica bacterium]|nr:2-C-methyl-D-erythritol 2,4-cyclodiphosphate synthase [Candidatus Omnitrophota bacterium]
MIKVGIGYDVHRLVEGRRLMLGGIEIPFEKGLDGHSDADVLIHAICDSVLGAAGEGDIGVHFPPTDPKYKDISSIELLKMTKEIISKKGFVVNNIDVTLIAQRPRIGDFRLEMRKLIAGASGALPDSVNIKATTTEGLGSIGREEGMAAFAVATIKKR